MNKTPTELVGDIDTLIGVMYARQLEDPEGLSKSLAELAIKVRGVGIYLTEARLDERNKETAYKNAYARAKLMRKQEMTVAEAESQALLDCVKDKEAWNEAIHRMDILRVAREDVAGIVDAMRSRLSLIKGDIRNA